MALWFYSDPHFGHKNVIEYCKRPFTDVDHQTLELIARYNSRVAKDDTVIWLGDCFFCKRGQARQILSQLNGRKIVVLGNHDAEPGKMQSLGFDFAMFESRIRLAGHPVKLSHYPYAPPWWKQFFRGKGDLRYLDRRPTRFDGWLLHGHVHQAWKMREKSREINVGVDVWDFKPVSFQEVEALIQRVEQQRGNACQKKPPPKRRIQDAKNIRSPRVGTLPPTTHPTSTTPSP